MIKKLFLCSLFLVFGKINSQNMVTYAGGAGNERFTDVMQLSNGNFIVLGSADNLSWISGTVPQITLTVPGTATLNNQTGTNKVAFIAEFNSNLQTMLKVYCLPPNVVENFEFVRTNSLPGAATGNLYISGDLSDAAGGGYFIGRLNNNFVTAAPTGFTWMRSISAKAGQYIKNNMPWDVGSNNKIVYALGDSHDYNWSAVYAMNGNTGVDIVMNNWRIHNKVGGGEHYGAANTFTGGINNLSSSVIVFKRDGTRCDLRSTTATDYNLVQPDGNGGTKKGKWPLDVCFNGPCVPGQSGNSSSGPGYTGYSPGSTFTYGMSSICIDRRSNDMYLGFNFKTTLPVSGLPDFEPAVMRMDSTGDMKWWTRLYHEMLPATSNTTNSTPDQYIDAIAIDYSVLNNVVIGARSHGNNTENLWEGNTVSSNTTAVGFQNQFTGNSGNIHLSWLGRFDIASGTFLKSTYMGEYAEGATGLGAAHPDPNLDGWPSPTAGWPTLNSTFMGKNNLKITANGSVLVLGKGRRTITTRNAYQKMVKPAYGGKSCWNDFVRVYKNDLTVPLYSSLLVGVWDTINQTNGDNVRLMNSWKVGNGVVVVGYHTGTPNNMPVTNVPNWGNSTYSGESAVLAYLTATNIANAADDYSTTPTPTGIKTSNVILDFNLYPNPTKNSILVTSQFDVDKTIIVTDITGRVLVNKKIAESNFLIDLSSYNNGIYFITLTLPDGRTSTKKIIKQ